MAMETKMATSIGIENTFNNCCIALVNDKKQVLYEKNCVFIPSSYIKQDSHEWHKTLLDFHKKTTPFLINEIDLFIQKKGTKVDFLSVSTVPGPNAHVELARMFARMFERRGIPIIEVDHVDCHLLSSFFSPKSLNFPFVSLTVAGGHCYLRIARGPGNYQLLGSHEHSPRNSFGHGRAVGAVLDKCAELLGLVPHEHPDGAIEIDRLVQGYSGPLADFNELTVANKNNGLNFDFHLTYELTEKLLAKGNRYNQEYILYVAASLQDAVMNILLKKVLAAAKTYSISQVAFGGGVAANNRLRELAECKGKEENVNMFFAPKKFCVDNAMMVALSGLIYKGLL
jgi:N6-L-threonylcarbamoyladenine synthase